MSSSHGGRRLEASADQAGVVGVGPAGPVEELEADPLEELEADPLEELLRAPGWSPASEEVGHLAAAFPAEEAASAEDPEPAVRVVAATAGWRHVLGVGLVCFALWLVFDGSSLYASSSAQPFGARRSAAMMVLRPIARLGGDVGASAVVSGMDRALGRDGSGVVTVRGGDLLARTDPSRPAPAGHPSGRQPPAARGGTQTAPGAPSAAPEAPDGLAPLPAPSAAHVLSVLCVGDSIGIDLGNSLLNALSQIPDVDATLDARVDTGLSRPDYFDWPTQLQADLARYRPGVVVVFIGANDPQDLVGGGSALPYGSAGWDAAYAGRVGAFMAAATSAGARVLWVGLPPMADPGLDQKMQALNAIYQSQAALHPGVTYAPSWPVLSDPQGNFTTYLADASGAEVAVRTPDGIHLSPAGSDRLAASVIGAIDHAFGLALQP